MFPHLYRSTSWILSAALLLFAGLGDGLHMLPGMGHAGHCHGWACQHADMGNDSHTCHNHNGRAHKPKSSCSSHSQGCSTTSLAIVADETNTKSDASGQMQDDHVCGLCKFLASLKQITPTNIQSDAWSTLEIHQAVAQAKCPYTVKAFSYQGRAPPVLT